MSDVLPYQLHALHPFVDGELILAGPVVQMLDGTANNLPCPCRRLGAGSVDDVLGEVGVEAVGGLCGAVGAVGTVGSHGAVVAVVELECEEE